MKNPKKYSIIFYLEGQNYDHVRKIQQDLYEITGSKTCLESWEPHISIGDGIIVEDGEQEELDSLLERFVNNQKQFDISTEGFGGRTDWKGSAFPYVLWINIEVSEELKRLVQEIKEITSPYSLWWPMPRDPYKPHITLASRDLTEEGYEKGNDYLKTLHFDQAIKISHIALVESLPDKNIEYKRFYFDR